MNMKKLYTILLSAVCLFAFASCDDFLDIKPTNYQDSDGSIQSYADAEVAMNGLVRGLLSGSLYGRNMMLYADAKGGDFSVPSNGNGWDDLFGFSHSQISGAYGGFWQTGYNCMADINSVLTSLDAIEAAGTTDDFDNIRGMLLTYRGMIYFDLARLYGRDYAQDSNALAVPIVLEVNSAARPARDLVKDVYAQARKDLADAAPLISRNGDRGFIDYWGNRAILARIYMHMQKYNEALTVSKEIIEHFGPNGLYSNTEWANSWKAKWQKESIIEFAVMDDEADLGNNALGQLFRKARDGGNSRIYGNFTASDQFLARLSEDPDDIRWSVMDLDGINDKEEYDLPTPRKGSVLKYVGGLARGGDGAAAATAVNIKYARLSEFYLVAAEAALKLNQKEDAAEYLQAIRKRSPNLAPATAQNITLDMIMSEKSKEFATEGLRFWDRIRNDETITYDDKLYGGEEVPHPDRPSTINLKTFYKVILPVPDFEMSNNKNMVQNDGYKRTGDQ